MSKKFTSCIHIIHFLITVSLRTNAQTPIAVEPAEKHTGFLSVTATMTITKEQYERMLLDSLIWHEVKPLVKNYLGKKIKQIIYQKNSGRVVVYFNRRDNIVIKKERAVKDGLFNPEPLRKAPYLPHKPIDLYLDSPLYIGIDNMVSLYQPDASDIIIPNPQITVEKNEGYNSYTMMVDRPGNVFVLFADSATRKVKYVYHAVAKRLHSDQPDIEPVVQLGSIKGGNTDTSSLKLQNQIIINSNFSIAGGTVYFTGTGFRDVIVVDLDKGITYAKPYLDLCMPGSTIIFDNLLVNDPSGKLYSANGFSIKVTDESFLEDSSIDYYSLSTYPQFSWGEGSLESYVKEHVAADKNVVADGQSVSFIMKIETDGSISSISDMELATLSPLEKKCFEIIKNGPAWTPGSFKGKNIPMTVTFYCSF
jgi:hypothetical protein